MMQILSSLIMQRIGDRLAGLYGEHRRERLLARVGLLAGRYGVGICREADCGAKWDQTDAILITYGDMVSHAGEKPLFTLRRFLDTHLKDAISGVHVLPFFPYSSDDGFSVIDFRKVDENLGDWDDIHALSESYRLMVDMVLNHISSQSAWFRAYRNGIAPEREFFIEVDPEADLSAVVRPRSLPLLKSVYTPTGEHHVWTTFSDDQIDLNFANPDLLFEMLDILLLYVHAGADIIRLDAIAYLWKEIGGPCIHLPQTHEVVKLMRDLLELLAPGVVLLTETNVPHEENVSYFGDGDEAQMVYQFSLPPLLLHALHSGDDAYLSDWAANLQPPPAGCTYFNFTASHDGIGVRPLEGLLPQDELEKLAEAMRRRGASVSTRRRTDGADTPYELNITYFDALGDPDNEDDALHAARFLCSQAVMLGLQGIPGVYFNSLIGGQNDLDGVENTGRARSINRRKWNEADLNRQLSDTGSREHHIIGTYRRLLRIRRRRPAFHPDAAQRVLSLPSGLFGFIRTAVEGQEQVIALHNLTTGQKNLDIDTFCPALRKNTWQELIQDRIVDGEKKTLRLEPYQTLWLLQRPESS